LNRFVQVEPETMAAFVSAPGSSRPSNVSRPASTIHHRGICRGVTIRRRYVRVSRLDAISAAKICRDARQRAATYEPRQCLAASASSRETAAMTGIDLAPALTVVRPSDAVNDRGGCYGRGRHSHVSWRRLRLRHGGQKPTNSLQRSVRLSM